MTDIIQSTVNQPFINYDAQLIEIPYDAIELNRVLSVAFVFVKEAYVENDECSQIAFNCDKGVKTTDVDSWELIWENCSGLDILTTPTVVTDSAIIVSITFPASFQKIQDRNYFRLWTIKGGDKTLVGKGVIFARK